MSLQSKSTSRSFKSKNYRTDAMKLLNDLLTTNTNNIVYVKGGLDNSKNKTQYSKTSKSDKLFQNNISVTYDLMDSKRRKRLMKNQLENESQNTTDLSILQAKEDQINTTNSGFPTMKQLKKCSYQPILSSNLLQKNQQNDECISEENKNKRNLLYQLQSYKQIQPKIFVNCHANHKIYDMVFYKKPYLSQTLSTNQSETKIINKKYKLSLQNFYIGEKLGSGKFGEVYAAKHKKLGFVCALKKIKKEGVSVEAIVQLIRQIKIQSFLDHPNIVKLYNFFSDDQFIYLMMEYCASGDMYSFLKHRKRLDELCVQTMMKQVCKAIEYMHQNNIIHRDLKPENILLNNGMAKICDFGWSISSTVNRQTFCGTPLYVSPELLKRNNYNNKIDVWSVGILTYELLFGKVPFDIFTEGDLIKIVQDEIYFNKRQTISENAKNFIMSCLQKDPRDRSSISQLLDHPFLKIDLDQSVSRQKI